MQYVKPVINTGAERSVTGHFVSGAIAAAVVTAGMHYSRHKNEELDRARLCVDSSKAFLQGGAATASAISAANQVGKNDLFGALLAIGVGVAAVYSVEKVYGVGKEHAAREPEQLNSEQIASE